MTHLLSNLGLSLLFPIGTSAEDTIDLLTKHQQAVRVRNRIADQYKLISTRENWVLNYMSRTKALNAETMENIKVLEDVLIKLGDF